MRITHLICSSVTPPGPGGGKSCDPGPGPVTRARDLCEQLGETPQLDLVLYRLWIFYFLRGEVQTARELAEQMMRLAQSVQDSFLLSRAHLALGWTLYQLGELTSARSHA